MVINIDQTAIRLVPSSAWTMDERGTNRISLKGLDDKREITALLVDTLYGTLLPPQLLFEGKTDRCHPAINFPDEWNIFHTENHWSNTSTVLRFVTNTRNM